MRVSISGVRLSSSLAYEGFWLPILEAMHCGAPVVAGNNSSQIEVIGDAGLLFNFADAGELSAQLARILGQSTLPQSSANGPWPRPDDLAGRDRPQNPRRVDPVAGPEPSRPRRFGYRPVTTRRVAFFSPLPPLRSEVADDPWRSWTS